jgi:hypothetical protein
MEEIFEMLTESQRQWILKERDLYDEEDTSQKRMKDKRIRDKAREALKNLAFLARNLDPDQHRQVFTKETLLPIGEAFHAYSTKEKERFESDKDVVVVNKELFQIGVEMSNWFLLMARNLIAERYYRLIWGTGKKLLPTEREIDALTQIYYETQNTPHEK